MKQMKAEKKEIQGLGVPWEEEFGYAQGVKLGNMVWLSGQVGHDDKGTLAKEMEGQMALAYANIKKLLIGFDMTMNDVTEEVLYVMDINAAFIASKKIRKEYYPEPRAIASTLIAVNGLVLPGQLIEIKIVARK